MNENNDLVQVVRCKDCVWYMYEKGCPIRASNLHDKYGKLPHATDFCSYAERRVLK